jgi:DNA-binding CsgD family transcriptional regulator
MEGGAYVRLVFRPVAAEDFPAAFECVRDGFLYDGCSKQILFAMWSDLLSRRIASGSVVEDLDKTFGPSIVGFGIGAFARPQFAQEVSNGSHPYISVRIMEMWRKDQAPVLELDEIAAGNVSGGLHRIIFHSGMHRDLMRNPDAIPILDQREALFHYSVSGFRLKSFLMEAYGEHDRSAALGMRYKERSSAAAGLAAYGISPRPNQHPFVFGLDAKDAPKMRGTLVASLFTYSPPVLAFTSNEKEMLLYALGGHTDQELAKALCMSYPTIRKRWDSVYAKVYRCLPGIVEDDPYATSVGRGPEKKRRILRYVQFHREELRPYAF